MPTTGTTARTMAASRERLPDHLAHLRLVRIEADPVDEAQPHGHSVPMRYRDQPTTEVSRRLACPPEVAWEVVTDIELSLAHSPELRKIRWVEGSEVAVGNVFRGDNENPQRGAWSTDSIVTEVEPGRRWTWDVQGDQGPMATWGFEVDPAGGGCIVRQWGRLGPGRSGLTLFIKAQPDKESRIVEGRLAQWREGMEANLAEVERRVASSAS